MALPKVARYVNNVGKSMVYASMDVIKEDMPTISAMVTHDSNKEVYKAIYAGIRDYRTTFTRATRYVKTSKIYKAADLAVKSAAEDLASGKWYNAERSKKLEEAAVEAMGGFGDDEDWDFGDESGSEGPPTEVSKGDKLIAAATEVSSHKAASMVSSTILATSKAQIEATQASTNFLYAQNAKLMGELRSDVVNTGARSIQEQTKTNTILENLATNSQKFFENTSKQLQELVAIQKEAVEMQRNLYGDARASQNNKKNDNKVSFDDLLTADGVLDLKAYGKSIKRNAMSLISEKSGGMFDSLMQEMGDKSMLELFAANPLGMMTTGLLRGSMSKQLQSSLKRLDKTIAGTMGTMISRMNNMAKNEEGNIFSQLFGRVFGFNVKEKSTIDVGKFTKGPVPFDGITRATINNAIPVYLARIESALTGNAPRIYNAYTGHWQTSKQLGDAFRNMKQQAINSGTSDIASELVKQMLNNKKYRAGSIQDREKIADNINKFLEALYKRGGDFKLKSWDDWYELGVEGEDMLRQIMGAYRGMPRHKRLQAAQQVMDSKHNYTKQLERMEEEGSVYANIFSGAYDKKQLYSDPKKGYVEEAKSGLANTLSLAKDNKGKDIWYYLQNMYTELYRVRQAIGGGSGIPSGLYGTGRQYRELASPITDTHEKTNREKYNEARHNQAVRYNEELQKFIDEGGKEIDIQDGETMRRIFLNMSAEDREKAKRDLDNSSNFFQRALYNNQWDLDTINAEREKHNKSKLKGKFLEVFREATLDEKLKMAGNYLSQLTAKPNQWATNMIEAADKRIYDLFYGQETGKEDEKGNKIRGMMNLMTFKFNQTLNKMTSWADDNIFSPIKKKLGIESFSDLLDKIGITKLFEGITNKVLGEKGPNGREGGFLSEFGKKFSEAITEKAKGADNWFKNAFSNVLGPLKNKLKLDQGGPVFNSEQEFDVTGYDTSSITGHRNEALAAKYATVMKSFSRDALKTTKVYRDKFAGGAASSMIRNGTSLSVDNYFQFRKNILKMIKSIILSFNEFPIFIEEMNTGKNKAGFDPNALANAPLNVLPKLFNMILDTLRTAKPVNFMPLEQYNAAYRLAGLGINSPIGKFINAKEKAISTVEAFLRDQNTQNMFKAEGGSEELKNLLDNLKQIKSDSNEEKKSLADRLADYKARKAAGDPSIKTITRRSVLGNSKYSDQATKVVTEANSVMAKQKQTDDEKLQIDIEKLHKKLAKSFGLSDDTSRNLLSLLMELAFNRNVRDLEKVLAGDLYNYAVDYGYTDLSMAIDKAMITKYNNTQADLGSLASARTVKPKPKDNIFNKATEILEKIYNLLLINMGDGIPRDFTSQDTADMLKSYDRRNAIFLGQRKRNRESETRSGEDSHSDEPPEAHAFGGFFKKRGLSALSKGEIYGRDGLYGKVPKTGVYDVKAGTTIYPTKSGDKAIELAKEQKAIENFIKSNATGENANTKVIDGKAYTQITNDAGESIWVRQGSDGKWYKLDESTLIDRIGDTARRGANAVVDAYNTNQRNLNREHQIKINGTNPKAIAKDIQKNLPNISATAALGAAAGLLFGNPLLGAAIGGSVATVQVSETAKNMLFGKEVTDEAGNKSRSGGFISKGVQDTFKKYFPSMSQHAAVGATLGLLTPFGLVGGALLGSAAGFVQKNESAHIALFGTPDDENSGIISKKSRDKLKKIAPNLFAGAAATALLGPFGLVGNIALGAGLGMASTTDEFQNAILGEEVEIAGVKTRVGGLVGTLNTEVIIPLKDWGKNFAEDTANFFKDKVLSPLSEAFIPIITEIGHVGKGAIRLIPKTIDMMSDMLGGTPLGAAFAKAVQAPKAVLGIGAKAATTVAKGTILAPVTAISALGKGLKNKQIRGGYANYMTAQERLDYRAANGRSFGGKNDKYNDIDQTLAGASSEEIQKAIKATKLLISSKDFKSDIRAKRRKIKAVLIEFFETKTYKKMERMVDKDEFSNLIQAIQTAVPRQGVTEQQKSDIIELITTLQTDIQDFHNSARKNKDARDKAYNDLNEAGFKGLNARNIDKFYASLRNEEAAHKATDLNINPEQQHMEDTVTNVGNMLGEKLDAIIKSLTAVEEGVKEDNNDQTAIERLAGFTINSHDDENVQQPSGKLSLRSRMKAKLGNAKGKLSGLISKYGIAAINRIDAIQANQPTSANHLSGIDSMHFDEESNSMVDLRGITAFRGRLNEKESSEKERVYYDSDSNSVRVFRRTLHGWKEVAGKAKTDADKQEDVDDEKKMSKFAKILAKFRHKDGDDDDDKDKKKDGIWSKIKGFVGKGLGLIGKFVLGATAAAGLGHGIDFAKDKLVPGLKTWWSETAAPWLEAKVGPKLNGIYDFLSNLPEKIMNGTKNVFKWIGDNKDTLLKWYTDGIQSLAGYIAGGFKWVVGNIWPILGNLFKYGVWPAIKGIGQGIASWFKPKEVPDLRDDQFKMSVDSKIDSSAMDTIINSSDQAASRLGLVKMGKIQNISMPTTNMITTGTPDKEVKNADGSTSYITKTEATNKAKELNDKLAKAKTPEERQAIINEMSKNAYWGQVDNGYGEMVNYYDHDLMAKDKSGNTIRYDENGNLIQHYDATGNENKLAAGLGRMLLTGNKGILVGGTKAVGKGLQFSGKLLSKAGKYTSKVPLLGTKILGKGAQAVGGISQATGSMLNATSTAIDLVPTAAGNNNTIAKLIKLLETGLSKLMEYGPVKKLIAKAIGETGEEVTEELIKKKGAELVAKVTSKMDGLLKKFTQKASSGVLGKIGSVLKSAAKLIGPMFLFVDFISGWNNAESYLGVVKESGYEVNFIQRLVCALANVINGKFLLGIVPIENIVDVLVDIVLPIFGADVSKLKEARERSMQIVAQFNAEEGTDYDISSFNKRNSVFVKLKKFGTEAVKEVGAGTVAAGKKYLGNMKNILTGKPTDLINSIKDIRDEDGNISPSKVIGSVATGVTAIGTFPIMAVTTGIRAVSENFSTIKDGLMTAFKDSVTKRANNFKYMMAGDPGAIVSSITDVRGESGNLDIAKLAGSATAIPTAMMTFIPAAAIGVVKHVGSNIKEIFTTGYNTIMNITKDHNSIAKLRKKGDVIGVANFGLDEKDKDSAFSGLRQGLIGIQKMWEVPFAGLYSIGNKVKEFFGLKNDIDIKGWVNKMAEYGDTSKKSTMAGFDQIGVSKDTTSLGGILQNLVASLARGIGGIAVNIMRNTGFLGKWASKFLGDITATGEGSGNDTKPAYGTGRAYQRDPSVANIRFNKSGDSRRQTIGDSGCGPAAAVNAVNYAYGTGNNLISAAKTAINYKEKDGGTRPEFFNNYFKSQGLTSTRLSGPTEIERNIRSGNPTVLMGRDPRGGAATPYGPNPHYVTAKGFDARGHIIIDDPESPSGSVAYDKNKVLGRTTIAVGASRHGRSKWGRGKWGMASAPAPGDTQGTKKVMWSYLLSKGYNENSAAAIMGNWGQECSFNYSLVQKGASNPGLGIAQWTYKTRKNAFLAAVPDWKTNLMGQLDFFWNEVNSGYTRVKPEKLNTITDLYAAVREFHDVYEQSADKTMDNRNKYAAAVYQEFTGSAPVALPSGGSSSTFSSQVANNLDLSSGRNTVMGQLGEKIGGLVKSALAAQYGDTRLGAIFGSSVSNSDSSTTSTTSTDGIDQAAQMGQTSGVLSQDTTNKISEQTAMAGNMLKTAASGLSQAGTTGLMGMGSGNRAKYGMGVGGLYTVQITKAYDSTGKEYVIEPPKETSGATVGLAMDSNVGQTIRVVYKYKDKAGDKAGHTGYITQDLANKLGLFKTVQSGLMNVAKRINVSAQQKQNEKKAALASISKGDKIRCAFSMVAWADIPYEKMIMSGDTAHLKYLNNIAKALNSYPSAADGKKTVKAILKQYYSIDIDPEIKFANQIGVYADWKVSQLRSDKNDLYKKLEKYVIDVGSNFKSQSDFDQATVGFVCEKLFGLTFDGERVAPPVYAGSNSAGGELAAAASTDGFDTASGISTEASSSSMGTIFDAFKSAFASAFDYTDSDGNKQNLLSLLGLGGASSSGSSSATTATGGAITGTSTGVQGAMANGFPYYNQSDPAWGSVPYGKEGTISSSGCGPTSMAMVAKSYGANVTPEDTMKWSLNNGHRVYGAGTAWDFFRAYGNSIGVQTEQAGPSSNFMTNKLRSGVPIISSMRKGHFTKGGHFIVLSGIDEQGNILVNDPSSTERTGQKWSPDIVAGESKQMWAISRDGKGSIGTLSQDTADKIDEQTAMAGNMLKTAASGLTQSAANGLMGMGSGNYAKYGRGVTPAQVDYSQILKAMAMSLDQLVENTSLLAQIIQILTSGNFGSGSGISAKQAAAIADVSAKSASTMRDKMNNMLNLSNKNMGNIASGRDANNIIQTMTQIASQ